MPRSRVRSEENKTEKPRKSPQVDWAFVERCLETAALRTILLWGPSGTGKTFAALRKGDVARGVRAITLTEETPAAELRGFFRPGREGMEWHDGPVVRALREGGRLVVNELEHASPDVLALLYPVLESQETAVMTLPTGEDLRPAPGFRCVATSNDAPSNLPAALRDRLDCVVEVDAPHPEALARLPEHLREAALQTYDIEPERALSLRGWIKVAELEPLFGLFDACRAVFGTERGRNVHEALTMRQLAF